MDTGTRRGTPGHTLLFLALASLLPQVAGAIDLEYEASLGVIHNSNIALSETDEISETTISPGIAFEVSQEGATLELAGRGNVRYLHYTGNSFDDEFRGQFTGHLRWRVIPERLDFIAEDYLSEQPVDILSSFAPNNTQRVNIVTGGPTLYLRFNGNTRGQFDLRYSRSHAEETTDFNGHRYNAALRVLRDFSATTRGSLNLESTRVDFDEAGSSVDYDRHDGYLNFQRNLNRIDFSLDAGYSRLERDGIGGDHSNHSSALFRADFNWRATAFGTLSLHADHQFSDATQALSKLSLGPEAPVGTDIDPGGTVISSDTYRQRDIRATWHQADDVSTLDVGVYRTRSRYIGDDSFDNDVSGAHINYEYRIRPLLTVSASAFHQRREFDNLDRRDRDTVLTAGVSRQFTRHWIGRFDLRRISRNSTSPGLSHDDNAVIVSVIYRR
ncbi:porin family protein [Marilutibacter alkalisoli]|uniref:Outer membrane beta-barrel protein n=1 Tax=Marilutibacter alkalisoli TaxID=2591633 RepID=A0A514BQV3_9GAMM|nr:hypothetical protein [Lysobacter alkalisoli]QDH69757.1 hypothetical protein FKV23_06345 [Lysobacter alkalisoli]